QRGEYRGDGRCQVAGNVVAAGKHRAFGARQAVGLGLVGEQEERVQAAVLLVAVEASLRHALCVKRVNALGGDLPHLIEWTEFDRLRRTRGRARRLQVVLQAVVTEGAFLRRPGVAVERSEEHTSELQSPYE